MRELAGAIAAITGAGSGIGRALAVALQREGVTLALADRDAEGLAETARLLGVGERRVSTHVVDVADRAAVDAFAADVLRRHGRITIVVNNAGVALSGSFAELAIDEIAWLFSVNFWGTVYVTRAFLPALVAQREAALVNLSSAFGLYGPPGQSAYAASKFAVRGFSESLRAELAGTAVHVCTVHPGGIKTAIARSSRIARGADAKAAAALAEKFERSFLTTPPEKAAAAIVRALKKRQPRVIVGNGARTIDIVTRLFPVRGPALFNRRSRARARRKRTDT